jgi:hypothetical protein
MKRIPINKQQRKELLTGLSKGVLYLSVVPELAEIMPKTIDWFRWLNELPKEKGETDSRAHIELDRIGKIAILQALHTGNINLCTFTGIAEKEEKRDRFLELMILASDY